MATPLAKPNLADLRKWAKVVREERVTFNGKLDPLGNLQIALSPFTDSLANDSDDDLADRLERFGKR